MKLVEKVFWKASKEGSQRWAWRAAMSSDICGLTGFMRGPPIPELQTGVRCGADWGGTEEIDVALFFLDLRCNAMEIIF